MKRLLNPMLVALILMVGSPVVIGQDAESESEEGLVHCANLIYGQNKTSVCFSDEFLVQVRKDANIRTYRRFTPVKVESDDLFDYPFSVMTGEGSFTLTVSQRQQMRDYLELGGFVVASAGCSSKPWNDSFKTEMGQIFPDHELVQLEADHPVFHTVYDMTSAEHTGGTNKLPELYGLELDGRMVMIWSPDGLNDTANAGPSCCCCGGSEVKEAKQMNVNLLAYALTH